MKPGEPFSSWLLFSSLQLLQNSLGGAVIFLKVEPVLCQAQSKLQGTGYVVID